MKISQLLETIQPNPIPVSKKFNADSGDLYSWVLKIQSQLYMHDSDEFQTLINPHQLVQQRKLFATQDWLDFDTGGGGGDPVIEQLDDKPVVVNHNDRYYILDGHHRCALAFEQHKLIAVYLFEV